MKCLVNAFLLLCIVIVLGFGEVQDEISHYLVLYRDKPSDLKTLKKLGSLYKKAGDYEKAIDFYNLCISVEPDNSYYYYQIANCYKLKGRIDKAFNVVTNALYYFENDFRLNMIYGDILLLMGEKEKSEKVYERLLKRRLQSRDLANLYSRLGKLYTMSGNFNKAEAYFLDSLRLMKNPWTFYYLSRLYEKANSNEKAIWAIRKAIAYKGAFDNNRGKEIFYKKYASLLYKKGILLKEKGDIEGAKAVFKEIVKEELFRGTIYQEKSIYWLKRWKDL